MMSRLASVFLLFLLAFPTFAPVFALEPADTEIVYRVNLGRADDVMLLLQQGASADEKNNRGVPLIALASARRDPEGLSVVKALAEAGADVKARDKQGQTALFYAGKQGNKEIVSYLLAQGIDAYAIDNNGDMARTVAFREGHKEIVTIIDDFVKQQSEKISKQYKEIQALQERYELQKAIAEEQKQEATAPVAEAPSAKPAEKKPSQKQLSSDLSFNTCAFQYWDFCRSVSQSTELSKDELGLAIDAHKEKINSIAETMIKEHKMSTPAITKISDDAQKRIFKELNDMLSNTARHENGVGKMEDMRTRCQTIAAGPAKAEAVAKPAAPTPPTPPDAPVVKKDPPAKAATPAPAAKAPKESTPP